MKLMPQPIETSKIIDNRSAGDIIRGIHKQLEVKKNGGPLDANHVLFDIRSFSANYQPLLDKDPRFQHYFETIEKIPEIKIALEDYKKKNSSGPQETKAPDETYNDTGKEDLFEKPEKIRRQIPRRAFLSLLASGVAGIIGLPALSRARSLLTLAPSHNEHTRRATSTQPPSPEGIHPAKTTTSSSLESTKTLPSPSPITYKTSPSPEATRTPEEKKINLIEEILKPLTAYAIKQREIRGREDPEQDIRTDNEINKYRINCLLFGYGEEHGYTYEDYGGSISILSIDTRTGQLASFSLSRDILTPELTQLVEKQTGKQQPVPIREVFKRGIDSGDGKQEGYRLMRQVTERATGLNVDFQMILKDTVIRDFLQEITGPLIVNVDKEHSTSTYRLDRLEHPEGIILKGEQSMNAEQAMRFILAEDKKPEGKEDERSYRKNILLRAIRSKLSFMIKQETIKNLLLPKHILDFFNQQVQSGSVEMDFDPNIMSLALGGLGNALLEVTKNFGRSEIIIPEDNISIEASVHDPFFGDGSVKRVHNIRNDALQNKGKDTPEVIEDSKRGFLPDWMLVTEEGNPYSSDLINDYWGSIRRLIRSKLGFPPLKAA